MENKLLFALDIGTRSVVGLVGEQSGNTIRLLAVERQEHHTRAMLDGQIHDVPEVAKVLSEVKNRLEQTSGPLKKVSIAAAGRALCTIKASADLEVHTRGILSSDDENSLELAAIQAAQHQLATSNAVSDPTGYYCVGYSVVGYWLDSSSLKTLVGQRGKLARIELIATFLPRQVIDSLQTAVHDVGLEISTLTLEPIAAINVLIPPTMRHLNLTLVDVGAGTSDVAITRDGAVIGYGMVPCAGDEITESISQKYLLDFNIAETVKRQLKNSKAKKIAFTDILGMSHKVPAKEIIACIAPNVADLAQAIGTQILELNQATPQAVLLVGGGSLTPMLPEALAQVLDIPAERVAIRRPDTVEGITHIPLSLCTPDLVTPLGILKLSSGRTLNFITIMLNDRPVHLFNLGKLTIADALLAAGIDVRSLQGRPGLGITISANGNTHFIPGKHGKPGLIQRNGTSVALTDTVEENDNITVIKGVSGATPQPTVEEIITIPENLVVTINETRYEQAPLITINGLAATRTTKLSDRDQVLCRLPQTVQEILELTNTAVAPIQNTYFINSAERTFTTHPQYQVNGLPASETSLLQANDVIQVAPSAEPVLGELLGLTEEELSSSISVLFNNIPCAVPVRRYSYSLNGQLAALSDEAPNGSVIQFAYSDQLHPMVSDVLLAANFNVRSIPPTNIVTILLNGRPTEYTAVVKNGDAVDVLLKNSDNLSKK